MLITILLALLLLLNLVAFVVGRFEHRSLINASVSRTPAEFQHLQNNHGGK